MWSLNQFKTHLLLMCPLNSSKQIVLLTLKRFFICLWCYCFLLHQDSNPPSLCLTTPHLRPTHPTHPTHDSCVSLYLAIILVLRCMQICAKRMIEPFNLLSSLPENPLFPELFSSLAIKCSCVYCGFQLCLVPLQASPRSHTYTKEGIQHFKGDRVFPLLLYRWTLLSEMEPAIHSLLVNWLSFWFSHLCRYRTHSQAVMTSNRVTGRILKKLGQKHPHESCVYPNRHICDCTESCLSPLHQ